jgi:hypothetical protein
VSTVSVGTTGVTSFLLQCFTEKNNAKALLHSNNGINHFAEEVSA